MTNETQRILFVVNAPEFFLSHRLPLAIAAKKAGYDVHVATAEGPDVQSIQSIGFSHYVVPFARSGQNPLNELKTLISLIKLFKTIKPSLVHLITIKPVLYGGIAARLTGVEAVVSAVSGLGTVFLAGSAIARLRRGLVILMYRFAFNQKRLSVIFQNPDDRDILLSLKTLKPHQIRMIRGSGVDLLDYPFLPEPEGTPVVVMAARLLKDKGVIEFIEAAKILNERNIAVEMKLIGAPDLGNPTSVSQTELDQWAASGCVQLLGYQKNIAKHYGEANIVCLPSYREGLPKSLVEAAACGRPVVTTDVPGCRDAIIPEKTGLLVPVKNATALADAIEILIQDANLRKSMGQTGRALAEEVFAIEKIVEQHMAIYRELLKI
ncbi:glycosyltransferase family 4 protein [Vibrio fluvialis]|uniref:glycosyltransferase family 4 protein n=1 Tax=Vibrio fluvialis TaxID=676 RepID=UPI001F34DB8C|nr:glycosyltransferase family 4 protein [Vibrio fluvialis]MCE7648603.1 glycosyltransferase family 4 protein [Vibrio fluvialis]MCG6368818.1 glycosyltransferase family 4 protein [Vibrio fluvialis]MCG6375955.1 glycosyltransferase family 4 protein [Vibrio fluvialis]UPO64638.1 glycosyl transferase [Vibrio fluvialis]